MFETYTATQMADELNHVRHYDPYYTGALSLIDEATFSWALTHPDAASQQRDFSNARHKHMRSSDPQQGWPEVVAAADALADALRPYGEERLQFCGKPSKYGPCRGQLNDGQCPYSHNHTSS